jgi:thiamine biosynthesis protein ThiS
VRATINGQAREFAEELTLGEMLLDLGIVTEGIAVAVNGCVIPRTVLREHPLDEGDEIEIIQAVAGG